MPRTATIIVPLAALVLVTLAPPKAGLSCEWERPAVMERAGSPSWFVTLLTFMHSEALTIDAPQDAPRQSADRPRLAARPDTPVIPNSD